MRETTGTTTKRLLYVFQDRSGNSYLRSLFGPVLQELEAEGLEVGLLDYEVGHRIDPRSFNETAESLTLSSRLVPVDPAQSKQATSALASVGHILRYLLEEEVDVVMARGPLLACTAVLAARLANAALRLRGDSRRIDVVYDADGNPHDERAEWMNESKKGIRYQVFRVAELVSLAGASSTVVKSAVAIDELTSRMEGLRPDRSRYVVAPNGRDLDEFNPSTEEQRSETRKRHDVPLDAPVVGYCGTMAPHRYPPEPIFGIFRHLLELRPDSVLFIVTHQPDFVLDRIREAGLPERQTRVVSVGSDEVPSILPIFDAGFCLIEPVPSMRFVSPIKIGEYLLSGVPVVRTRGIGDIDDWLGPRGSASIAVESLSDEPLRAAARWIDEEVLPNREHAREHARNFGAEHFNRRTMVDRYRQGIELAWQR